MGTGQGIVGVDMIGYICSEFLGIYATLDGLRQISTHDLRYLPTIDLIPLNVSHITFEVSRRFPTKHFS